jgi:hypothetical protein
MRASAKFPAIVLMLTLFAAASDADHEAGDVPEDVDEWAAHALANPESDRGWSQSCHSEWSDWREASCDVREFAYSWNGRPITIDGGQNGGMTVIGWDRNTVRLIYRVLARAHTAARAEALAKSIRLEREDGWLRPQGPASASREWWSVEVMAWVPRSSNLALRTLNGPLGIQRVRGTMDIASTNGPVSLVGLSGAVQARVQNGPLHVELEGSRWTGAGLDAVAQNGPVHFVLPRRYSANLETGTINGPSTIDYALHLTSLGRGHINAKVGSGGAPVRVVTDNGPFHMAAR